MYGACSMFKPVQERVGVGGLIHGEYFIVDSYMLHNQAYNYDNYHYTTAYSGNITSTQLSQRLPLLHSTERSDRGIKYLHN